MLFLTISVYSARLLDMMVMDERALSTGPEILRNMIEEIIHKAKVEVQVDKKDGVISLADHINTVAGMEEEEVAAKVEIAIINNKGRFGCILWRVFTNFSVISQETGIV